MSGIVVQTLVMLSASQPLHTSLKDFKARSSMASASKSNIWRKYGPQNKGPFPDNFFHFHC